MSNTQNDFLTAKHQQSMEAGQYHSAVLTLRVELIPVEQSSYRNEGFLMLGEIVSGAEPGDTSNDRLLVVLRIGHIAYLLGPLLIL